MEGKYYARQGRVILVVFFLKSSRATACYIEKFLIGHVEELFLEVNQYNILLSVSHGK